MSSSAKGSSIYHSTASYLTNNRAIALKLPEPGERVTHVDLAPEVQRRLAKLREENVLERVGETELDDRRVGVYEVPTAVHEWIKHNLDAGTLLPCGHEPFRNLRDGEYACLEPGCEREFDRETVEAALSGIGGDRDE